MHFINNNCGIFFFFDKGNNNKKTRPYINEQSPVWAKPTHKKNWNKKFIEKVEENKQGIT